MQTGNIELHADAMWFRRPGESRSRHAQSAGREPQSLGVLILDSKGQVFFCSDALARLAGSSSIEMIGMEVRDFMPGIPFDPATEGYNVAFGAFCAARRCLQSWTLHTRGGGTVQLDGYFAMLKMPSGYVFCVELQQHAGAAIPAPDASPRPGARSRRAWNRMAGTAQVARSLSSLWRAPGMRAALAHWRQHPRHRPASGLQEKRAAARLPAAHSIRPPHVQLLLDRDYRIGFASSAIEDLLAHDYEKIVGMHVSDLLPELLSRLGGMCSVKNAKAKLRGMGSFVSHARHAGGHDVPVVVQLREKKSDQLISLLVSAPA